MCGLTAPCLSPTPFPGLSFWSQLANVFDTIVVIISIVSLVARLAGVDGIPNIKMFRLIRVVRVVRLFRRFESLNRIIKAISASILPVSNALFILLIFTVLSCLRQSDYPCSLDRH